MGMNRPGKCYQLLGAGQAFLGRQPQVVAKSLSSPLRDRLSSIDTASRFTNLRGPNG